MGRLLVFLMAAVPLAIAPGFLFYFDVTPKVILLLAGCAVAQLWPLDLSPILTTSRGRRLALLLSLQIMSLVLSTGFSSHPGLSLVGSTWRRFGLLTHASIIVLALLAAAYVAFDSQRLTLLLRSLSLAGMVAAIYGCAQYFGIDPWLPSVAYHIGEGEFTIVRPPGTLGHASYAASFYLQAAFSGLALAALSQTGWWRRLGWTTAAAASVAIILSGTRGAMVGWVAGVIVLAWALRPAVTTKRIAMAATLLLAGAVFYLSPAGQLLRSRTHWSAEDPRGGARLTLWKDAATMGSHRWLQGWGPESFVTDFPRFQSRDLARQFPDFYHESPHNVLLEAWTAQGLPGLLILAGLCALALVRRPASNAAACLLAAFVSLAVSLQFVSFTAPTAWAFYFTLATLIALDPAMQTAPAQTAFAWLRPVLSAIFAAYALHLAISDRALESSRRLMDAGLLRDSIRVYQTYRGWQAFGPTASLWFARALTDAASRQPDPADRLASLETALSSAEDATQTADDRHNAFYTLAQIHSLREDLPAVKRGLRQAIAVAPMWFKPHWTLAEALLVEGNSIEALHEAQIAADLDAGKDPEVTATLNRARAAALAAAQ